jgi:hypothetical protein
MAARMVAMKLDHHQLVEPSAGQRLDRRPQFKRLVAAVTAIDGYRALVCGQHDLICVQPVANDDFITGWHYREIAESFCYRVADGGADG